MFVYFLLFVGVSGLILWVGFCVVVFYDLWFDDLHAA